MRRRLQRVETAHQEERVGARTQWVIHHMQEGLAEDVSRFAEGPALHNETWCLPAFVEPAKSFVAATM
jgi:hypothetical protein